MIDVFVIYSQEDMAIVGELAKRLEARGYSVWWESALNVGGAFVRGNAQTIDDARVVVAVWTSFSVKSDEVYAAASRAMQAGKLIPLKTNDLDVRQIPPPFDTLYSLPFSEDEGLLRRIRSKAGRSDPIEGGRAQKLPQEARRTPAETEGEPGQYDREDSDVFVSYAREDKEVCLDLVARLRRKQLNVFYDEFLVPGAEWRGDIARNIRRSEVFVILLSEYSLGSKEVERELNMAASSSVNLIPIKITKSLPAVLPDAFQLILGPLNILDGSNNQAGVFERACWQARDIVALRAFNERRGRPPQESVGLEEKMGAAFRWARLWASGLVLAWALVLAVTAESVLSSVSGFGSADPLVTIGAFFVFLGVPYSLVCALLVKTIMR